MSKSDPDSANRVPPGNQPQGPGGGEVGTQPQGSPSEAGSAYGGDPAPDQDVKRRLGHHTNAGEQSIKQPGGKNGANS